MVRVEISEKVGEKVHVRAEVSVPHDGYRVAWAVQNVDVDGVDVDHIWLQSRHHDVDSIRVAGEVRRGDWVEFDAVVGEYVKRGGVKDYNLRDVRNVRRV